MTGPWLPQMGLSPSRESVWAPVLSSSRNLDLLFRYNTLPLAKGPALATLQAEAVGLLHLLRKVKLHFDPAVPLIAFKGCLVQKWLLLQILQKWGWSDFWPDPRDIIHFDVIFPLLQELHQWSERLKLVKVKSHDGCQLNEMADELADKSCTSDEDPVFPGQQKYGSLLLRVRASMRTLIDDGNTGHRLPWDGAPNKKASLMSTPCVQPNFKSLSLIMRPYCVRTRGRL